MKRTKNEVQQEGLAAFKAHNSKGILAMATGTGKSKIAIDYCVELHKDNFELRVLIVVPTEKLRDVNWKNEFDKWDASFIWNNNVERSCYKSINKIQGEVFDLVVLDEGHNITELNSQFFQQNTVHSVMVLTATPPTDEVKIRILEELSLDIVYRVTLDQAVEWGLVSPYKIKIVKVSLDTAHKYIKAGTKDNPFWTTESNHYYYLTKKFRNAVAKGSNVQKSVLNRMHFIYGLKSKTDAAKLLLEYVIPKEERTLIFAGTTAQADELCEHRFHSNQTKEESKDFDLFASGQINRLSSVRALNEGHNIDALDNALIIQVNSNELHLIQRIGRIIRYREDHEGSIYIIVSRGTVDEDWLNKALLESTIDESNIEYIDYPLLKMQYT